MYGSIQWGYGNGAGVSTNSCIAATIPVGALTANVDKTLTHNLGKTNITLSVFDTTFSNNADMGKLCPDPADPTNKVLIQSPVNILAGVLFLNVIGWN